MLQQTPVNRVIPHLEAWLARWPTPAALAADRSVRGGAAMGEPRAIRAARCGCTVRRWRSATGTAASCRETWMTLLALSGIGDYTARAVAVFAYGERHPVVDTNTRRVLARAIDGRSQPGPPARRDLDAMAAVLPADQHDAAIVNAATMELGATVCTARDRPVREPARWRTAARGARPGTPTRATTAAGRRATRAATDRLVAR